MVPSSRQSGHQPSDGNASPDLPEGQPADHEAINHTLPQQDAEDRGRAQGAAFSVPDEWARVFCLALKHLDRCVSLEPKVLHGDDPKAIHDLRVATRRLQQVLDLVFPSPRSGEIRKLYQGLKRCRRSLSDVRNYDVLLERVEGALARKRTARRQAWEAIKVYLEESRSVKLEKALRKLTKANLSSIYVRLKECLPAGGHPPPPKTGTSDHLCAAQNLTVEQFYTRISGDLKKRWEALEQQVMQSRHEPDPALLHRTRIAAKRVRYLIEVIHDFNAAESKEALIWLRNLQRHLGHWHDLVVFEETVIEMVANPPFLRDHMERALEIERLILRNRALKAKLERKYLEMTAHRKGFFKTRNWVRRVVESPSSLLAGSG